MCIRDRDERWRELIGREPAWMAGLSTRVKADWSASGRATAARKSGGDDDVKINRGGGVFRAGWRERIRIISEYVFTLVRDAIIARELSCNVALCRRFWWYRVNLWTEDMPAKSLMVLQSADSILDPHAIAAHALNRGNSDVLWLEGFAHGEVLAPQGYEARRRMVEFVQGLDGW